MYVTAYTTQFESLDGRLWTVVISINDYEGDPQEISLEGDEPCIIEWAETDTLAESARGEGGFGSTGVK